MKYTDIKIGDKVVCIDTTTDFKDCINQGQISNNGHAVWRTRLKVGEEYTVTASNLWGISIKEDSSYHSPSAFVKAEEYTKTLNYEIY